jgi:TPR repeat protein
MKKIFLLTILLFQLTFVFGQVNWSSWQESECFDFIQYRIRFASHDKNREDSPYNYEIEFKNTSAKNVKFGFTASNNPFTIANSFVQFYRPSTGSSVNIPSGGIIKAGLHLYKENQIYIGIFSLVTYTNAEKDTISYMEFENCSNGALNLFCQSFKFNCETGSAEGCANWKSSMDEKCKTPTSSNLTPLPSKTSYSHTYSSVNGQINGNNQAKTDAINQLTTTIISGIQEQKEWSAEQKRLKAERLQRAEDYMKNLEQKFINEINLADNGDIDKQNWVAYQFYDKQKYELAEEYYKMVMSNKDDSKIIQRESSSNNLASCYAINGKFLEQWNELNKKITSNTLLSRNTFQRTMLVLFSEKYEINTIVSDEMIKSAIQDLKNEKLLKSDAEVVLAYFQITGEYKLLGIPKNETEGLEILAKNTYSELASYFIGVLHLKGIGLKQDEKKAFDNFLNVIKLNKNQKNYKKFNVNSKSDLDFYKPIQTRHDIYQLTPLIMAYSEIAILLEKSSKDSDRNLLKYKNEFFEWFGNLLTLDDRTFWKINIVENPFFTNGKKIKTATNN